MMISDDRSILVFYRLLKSTTALLTLCSAIVHIILPASWNGGMTLSQMTSKASIWLPAYFKPTACPLTSGNKYLYCAQTRMRGNDSLEVSTWNQRKLCSKIAFSLLLYRARCLVVICWSSNYPFIVCRKLIFCMFDRKLLAYEFFYSQVTPWYAIFMY